MWLFAGNLLFNVAGDIGANSAEEQTSQEPGHERQLATDPDPRPSTQLRCLGQSDPPNKGAFEYQLYSPVVCRSAL